MSLTMAIWVSKEAYRSDKMISKTVLNKLDQGCADTVIDEILRPYFFLNNLTDIIAF